MLRNTGIGIAMISLISLLWACHNLTNHCIWDSRREPSAPQPQLLDAKKVHDAGTDPIRIVASVRPGGSTGWTLTLLHDRSASLNGERLVEECEHRTVMTGFETESGTQFSISDRDWDKLVATIRKVQFESIKERMGSLVPDGSSLTIRVEWTGGCKMATVYSFPYRKVDERGHIERFKRLWLSIRHLVRNRQVFDERSLLMERARQPVDS